MGIKAPAQGGEAGKGKPFITYDADDTVKFNHLTCHQPFHFDLFSKSNFL